MSSTHSHVAAAAAHRTSHRRPQGALTCRRRNAMKAHPRVRGQRFAPAETGLLLLLVLALAACVFISRSPQVAPDRTTTVRVTAGETLWNLARSHPVTGLSTAQTVELIADLNQLEDRALAVGTAVRVPSEWEPHVASR